MPLPNQKTAEKYREVSARAYEALQADLTPRMMRGRITALWQLSSNLSGASGTLMGGFLFQTFNPTLPFYLFTAAEIIASLVLVRLVREPRETRNLTTLAHFQ